MIHDGHSEFGRDDRSNNSRFKIGFEVEKEDETIFIELQDSEETLLPGGWVAEYDGSLNDESGFELISPIYDLFATNAITNDFLKLRKYLNAGTSVSCGGHIHISGKNIDSRNLLGHYFRGYLPLFYALYPRRVDNTYCKAFKWDQYSSAGKYAAFHIGHKTLEIRIFTSPNNIKALFFRLSLLQHVIKNPATDPDKVLEDLARKNSKLYKLLLVRYTPEELSKKAVLIQKLAKKYDGDLLDDTHVAKIIEKENRRKAAERNNTRRGQLPLIVKAKKTAEALVKKYTELSPELPF